MSESPSWFQVLSIAAGSTVGMVLLAALVGGVSAGPLPALVWLGLIALVIQWVAAVPAIYLQTETFYDITGSLSFIALMAFGMAVASGAGTFGFRQGVTALLVAVWAARLGIFLFARVMERGGDGRFEAIKKSPPRFFLTWTLQGLWVFVTALPALAILVHEEASADPGAPAMFGWTIFAWGLVIEVVADLQKSAHNRNPETRGRWIETGLWQFSRHPNYLGEMILWAGMWFSGLKVYQGLDWLTILSPIFVVVLISKVSGIPLLEERADAKWGSDPDYRRYKRRVSTLVPFWPED